MELSAYEGTVENGQIRLAANVRLPEKAKVYILVAEDQRAYRIMSPSVAGKRPEMKVEIVNDERAAGPI